MNSHTPTTRPLHPPLRRPPGRVIALHRQGDSWRVLVAQLADGSRPGLSVVEARTVAAGQPSALANLLREHKAARILRVLPAASTICRATTLPDGEPDEVAGALGLLAEAELPASIPAHRRAGGVVRPGPAGGAPLALLVGWPEKADAEPDSFEAHAPVWVPEPVALAALAAAHGGCRIAVYADRQVGSMALLGSGQARSLARILRADATTAATWQASIHSAVEQLGAVLGTPMIGPDANGDHTLHLAPADPASPPLRAVTGAGRDPEWLASYGIALGAALAYAAADPLQEPLLSLRPQADGRAGSLPERLITWLSAPARAAAAIILCLVLLLLVPLGVAAARAAALERRSGGAGALSERLAVADREAAFYDLLRARRWPMTKLLADVSGAAPVGIRVESVELSPEQSGPGLLVRGTAPSADAVTEFAANLAASRIVSDIATPSIAAEDLGVLFQLQARVVAPLFRAKPAADFAEQTLAQRLYGDAASRIRYDEPGAEPARDERRTSRREPRANESPDSSSSTESPTPAPAGEAPPPLTDEAIAAMDRAAVMKEFGVRRLAATRAAAGTPDRQRLDDEVDRLRRRLDALRTGGGGS